MLSKSHNSYKFETMSEDQTKWKNTLAAFRRQFTQIDKLLANAKVVSNNLKEPRHEMNAKQARRHIEPIEHKLGLVKNYVESLHGVLPLVSVDDEISVWNLDALGATLENCMERHTTGNMELRAFIDDIEEWESIHTKIEKKPDRTGSGGGTDEPRAPELKGVATTLKPEELTSSIQAHEMTAWREQWTKLKNNSAFSKHGKKVLSHT